MPRRMHTSWRCWPSCLQVGLAQHLPLLEWASQGQPCRLKGWRQAALTLPVRAGAAVNFTTHIDDGISGQVPGQWKAQCVQPLSPTAAAAAAAAQTSPAAATTTNPTGALHGTGACKGRAAPLLLPSLLACCAH